MYVYTNIPIWCKERGRLPNLNPPKSSHHQPEEKNNSQYFWDILRVHFLLFTRWCIWVYLPEIPRSVGSCSNRLGLGELPQHIVVWKGRIIIRFPFFGHPWISSEFLPQQQIMTLIQYYIHHLCWYYRRQ